MRPVRLLVQLAAWGLAFAALNVAVSRASRNSVPRAVARSIDQSPPATDVFLGNSLAQAGVDPKAFAEARPGRTILNAGLGSSYAPEHNVLLRRALKHKPARVFYGYFDDQLFTPSLGGWGDLVGNRAMAYYADPETSIRFYAEGDPIRALRMRLIGRLPLLVERQTLWAKVELVRRRLSQIGLAQAETNRFGRADDFRLLEAVDPSSFLRRCEDLAGSRAPFEAAMIDMIEQARRAGAEVILVEMPMPESHRSRFYDHPEWVRLRGHIREEANRAGARTLDASSWVGEHGFADPLHLNKRGAAEFSRKLAAADRSSEVAGPSPSRPLRIGAKGEGP